MTALSAPAPVGTGLPAAFPQIPAQRRPVDRAPVTPDVAQGHGRHRAATAERAQPARTAAPRPVRAGRTAARAGQAVVLASRAGSVVTLAAMLVFAAAAAGLSDGDAPTGDAAAVATATLR